MINAIIRLVCNLWEWDLNPILIELLRDTIIEFFFKRKNFWFYLNQVRKLIARAKQYI